MRKNVNTAKKRRFLEGYLENKKRRDILIEQLKAVIKEMDDDRTLIITSALPGSPALDAGPRIQTSGGDKLADVADRLEKNRRKYEKDLNELIGSLEKVQQRMRRILRAIDIIENPDYQMILTEKYIKGHTWQEVADAVGYSIRTLKNYKITNAINSIPDRFAK